MYKTVKSVKFWVGDPTARIAFPTLPLMVRNILSLFFREDDVFIVTYKQMNGITGYEFDFGEEVEFFPDPDYIPEDMPYEDLPLGGILEILGYLDPGDSVWVFKKEEYLHFYFNEDYIKEVEFLDPDLSKDQPLFTMKELGNAEFTFY